jgi:hypothetical protein
MTSRDWDEPIKLDPVVEEWGLRGRQVAPVTPDDYDRPTLTVPPPPEEEPELALEEAEEEYYGPAVDVFAVFRWAFFTVLALVIGAVIWGFIWLAHHAKVPHRTHSTWAQDPHTGSAFAVIVVIVVIVLAVRGALAWLKNGS